MFFVVLCQGTPEGSTGGGSGFKASQKTGQRPKVSSTDWEKPGIELATPGLQDIGLSPTPRRLPYNGEKLLKKSSETMKPVAFIFSMYQYIVVHYVNPADPLQSITLRFKLATAAPVGDWLP